MRKICTSFIATATCWLVLSLASHTLGADLNDDPNGRASGCPSRWRRFKERCRSSKKKCRPNANLRDGGASRVEATNRASSDSSVYSEWDSSSTSSGSAQFLPFAEEASSSSTKGVAEACASDVFLVKLASLSDRDIVPVVRHSLIHLGRQVELLGAQRAVYNENVRLYKEKPNPELLLSLKDLCNGIGDLKRRIRGIASDLHTAISSAPGKLGKEAIGELLLELEAVMFDVGLDDAVYVEADMWCLSSDGSVGPDEWWASQVVKEMFSLPSETRLDDEPGVDGAIAPAEAAGTKAAMISAEAEAGVSGFGAPTEKAEEEESTLVAEAVAEADTSVDGANVLPENSEEEESTLVPEADTSVDGANALPEKSEEEESTLVAEADSLVDGAGALPENSEEKESTLLAEADSSVDGADALPENSAEEESTVVADRG